VVRTDTAVAASVAPPTSEFWKPCRSRSSIPAFDRGRRRTRAAAWGERFLDIMLKP
jgi:hypothetical protein